MKVAFIAGEASGDQLGGWLMQALHRRRPDFRFIGLGGPEMQAQGLTSIFPIEEIALIGILEVLPHARNILRRVQQTVEFIEREQPAMLVCIDVPGFALRVLKQLHARRKVRPLLVNYVAPTVWAYRPERAKLVAERYDHLLCLLPFEPPYFIAEGLPTRYVGHEIAWWWKDRGDGAAFRARHGIAPDAPLLAMFPGSRRGELKRFLPVFRDTLTRLVKDTPTLAVVLQLPPWLVDNARDGIRDWPVAPLLLPSTREKKDLFAAATAALAKSGTIALECALAGLPSITAYRGNPLTIWLLRRMLTIRYANLANLLLDREAIPELMQENFTPEKLAAALHPLLTSEPARAAQKQSLGQVAAMLGAGDAESPSDKAATILLELLDGAQRGDGAVILEQAQ